MNPATSKTFPLRIGMRSLWFYQACDQLSGLLLVLMLLVTPWWFGTTQPHAIAWMNRAGAAVTLLLLCKWAMRAATGYRPARWDATATPRTNWTLPALGGLTLAILGYMLVSLLNARATWDPLTLSLQYQEHFLSWLPHTLETASTRQLLINYTALAGYFWALWDWLNGQTRAEQRDLRSLLAGTSEWKERRAIPQRLRWLLWCLCLNGAALAAEGIVQRLTNTNKLLWLVETTVFKSAEAQFGPYAYRANGAQLINLIWPVALGFWWTLHRAAEGKRWRHHLLLPAIAIMAAAPFVATTRAGAIIAGTLMVTAALWLAYLALIFPERRGATLRQRLITGFLVVLVLGTGTFLARKWGGPALDQRMLELDAGMLGRENLNEVGRRIAADYRWFGSGPGTLVAVYPYYRDAMEDYWPAQLHNDWLETRITFGRLGFVLILSSLVMVLFRWWQPAGLNGNRRLVGLIWLGLAGLLVHARFDFPFQIYSILLTALALCAVLLSLSSSSRT